jgi:hypothetical protein
MSGDKSGLVVNESLIILIFNKLIKPVMLPATDGFFIGDDGLGILIFRELESKICISKFARPDPNRLQVTKKLIDYDH